MTIRAIPAAFEYKCDNCGRTHLQENASGTYANSTPPEWMSLKVFRYNKTPFDVLLCEKCETPFVALLNQLTDPNPVM